MPQAGAYPLNLSPASQDLPIEDFQLRRDCCPAVLALDEGAALTAQSGGEGGIRERAQDVFPGGNCSIISITV